MIIRTAEPRDFEALRAIYNYEVENTCNNFDTHPTDADEWAAHMAEYNHEGDNHPLIVAEIDGVVCGYASLSPFRSKHGYAPTVELSVYVGTEWRRQGVGSALMSQILGLARMDENTHAVISAITQNNRASEVLHAKYGFMHCGTFHDAAFKKGSYHDVSFYELHV